MSRLFAAFPENRPPLLLWAALAGFGLSFFLIGRLLFSGFSILDDHTIIGWLGTGFWSRIASTEIVHFGHSARFRPLMFSVLALESWLFGAKPYIYHLARILWFGVFLWSIVWAAFRSIGFVAGLAVLFLVVNGGYWGNIWTHSLFASEQLASVGLGLVIFSAGLICSWFIDGTRKPLDTAVLLASTGTFICIGCKENFLPLVALNILLTAVAWRQNVVSRRTLYISLVLILLQLTICYGIILPNLGKSQDIYGGDAHFGHRLAAIFHVKKILLRVAIAMVSGAAIGAYAWLGRAERDARETRTMLSLAFLLLLCGVYVCWEQFFYNGMLPMGQRYDFPALLIDPFLAGAAVFVAVWAGAHFGWTARQFSPLAIQTCCALLVLNVAVFYYAQGRLLPIRAAARTIYQHTKTMASDLATARILASQHADWPIIVSASRSMDYESVVTLPIWLKYAAIANPASVSVDIPPQNIVSPLDKQLVGVMQDESLRGRPGAYRADDASVAKAELQGHCYIVEFQTHASPCVRLPYRPADYLPVD